MIKRIVKLTFKPELLPVFMEVFHNSAPKIRMFEGCKHMELLRSTTDQRVLFTLSIWDSEAALDNYRNSELFKSTWAKTKVLFEENIE